MRLLSTAATLSIPFITGFFVYAPAALAVGVGEQASCVVLTQLAPNGTESEHCIRDSNSPSQSKILEFFSATCSDCAANLPIVSQLATAVESVATTRLVGIDRDL